MFPANATFRTYRRRLENGFLFSMNFPHPLFFRYHRAETIDCQYAYAPEITSTTWQRTPYFQADRIPNYYVVALMAFLMEISPLRSFWAYLLARFPLFKVYCMHTLASLRPRRHFFSRGVDTTLIQIVNLRLSQAGSGYQLSFLRDIA